MTNPKKKPRARKKPEAHANISATPGTIWVDGHGVLNIGCPDVSRQINILLNKKREIQLRLVDIDVMQPIGPVLSPKAKCPSPFPPNVICAGCETIPGHGLNQGDFTGMDDPLDP